MNIEWTPIILAIIALVNTILVSFVIPLIKSKLTQNQMDTLKSTVRILVYAAEQLFPQAKSGELKKDYVRRLLKQLGYDPEDDEIDAIIEAMVKAMNDVSNIFFDEEDTTDGN